MSYPMLSVEEALERVVSGFSVLAAEQVGLSNALGRVLAQDLASRVTHPPAAMSSMDGYALRAADAAKAPFTLKLIGESAAGRGFEGSVGSGETVRIFTGAPLADGADAVEMQENTEADGDTVTFTETVAEGRFIRPEGLDFSEGDVLLKAGTVLGARDIGLAAAMNIPWLMVRRRPRVAVLSTGDELVMPGDPLKADQIINCNSPSLAAYVQALGGEAVDMGIARDDEGSLRAMLAGTRGADLLVTIGGASVGDHDLVRKVLGEEGLELNFFRVAMRPGKPLIFGHLGEVPVLGMPGNPVSSGVTAIIFLKAAMKTILGISHEDTVASALLGRDLKENDQRRDYLRAALSTDADGNLVATPFEVQDSAMMARFAEADCLVVRPPHAPPAKAGERAEIIHLRDTTISF